ncbi:flagellar basal-body rod protein FlgG [Methylobacterium radiodurans]|uniref:Flagellar basal-body rod protein FlgG n=1 Tax=Methylobacterium radiodurans TaxID=2202828 RepID=A0A2U8VWN7_9HYPH|nr:flagellar basal-body rod protein FlgG [Methylobacterium radiodurans]AWN37622.1 flagellar basal-body rod protein FlgG [Methylobacterium radiodurans]
MRALAIAATGMSAQQLNLEVIANNVANLNTTGFKGARAEFTDLLYQAERQQGVPNQAGQEAVPEGAMLGLGVRAAAIRNLHRQGSLAQTGNQLDLAVNGRGYFQVNSPAGDLVYTRAGSFNINATGQIVTIDGNIIPGIQTVPPDTTEIVVNQTGEVIAKRPLSVVTTLGTFQLANFANESGLEPLGNGLFRETAASGAAVLDTPGTANYGKIQQGYLEGSNVDPVKEITSMITAQRAFEMNSKVIQAADEMSSTVSKGIR